MAKPIILTVDDEVQVSNAIERDLRRYYGKEYRIVKATSAASALTTVQRLKQRNDQIALFLVDQRMPDMEGTEFLAEAMKIYPDARKVLLTAYADTQAAISAINTVGLDHYLMKPWDPPEQTLYPILDDLLGDWLATAQIPFDGIRVAGTLWSPASHRIKDFLARSQIPYEWLDIEQDAEARALVETVNEDQHRLPILFFPDGQMLIAPDITAVADKVGLQTQPTQPFYDLIIIGAGPAGLAAAVYGASEGLHTLLIDKETTGGQAGTSSRIENYLGFPKGLSGADLARRATAQATRLGAEILTAQEVVQISINDPYRSVTLADGTELNCRALIIATGASLRTLDVPGIEAVTGAGVYYGAAITEAAYYKGEHVFVVGGANSAGQGAMFFSRYASKVTMLVRGSALNKGMSQYLVDQIDSTENIEVCVRTSVIEVKGADRLEALVIQNNDTGETETVSAAALFAFIGAKPHTDFVANIVERNRVGFILTGSDLTRNGRRPQNWRLKRDPFLLETNVPGIFAVGDVRQGAIRRVASAVGQGSTAVSFVHQYLKTV
ncbi:FAD-dependent oxidoreductase [Candidatus Leptofilum sp.]|uniref:FAD-dependent oxidoreductase n=1 Tax=Candidatus Leptofilum sp. TaxID=3241576 RepID=UPI003B5B887E